MHPSYGAAVTRCAISTTVTEGVWEVLGDHLT